jgi:hypothetical protein
MAPHIATPVSVESATQTAGAAAIAVTGNNTEAAAKVIAAKTITSANMTRAGRGTRIAVLCEVPRGYTALASHGGRCQHGCGDQCNRQKSELRHSILHLISKANSVGSSMQMVKRLDR